SFSVRFSPSTARFQLRRQIFLVCEAKFEFLRLPEASYFNRTRHPASVAKYEAGESRNADQPGSAGRSGNTKMVYRRTRPRTGGFRVGFSPWRNGISRCVYGGSSGFPYRSTGLSVKSAA